MTSIIPSALAVGRQPLAGAAYGLTLNNVDISSRAGESTVSVGTKNQQQDRYSASTPSAEPSSTYDDPRVQQREKLQKALEAKQQQQEKVQIQELSARDREVRAHEQAHAAIGGQHAGAPKYEFERGPDGVSYAVGGEVSISTAKEATPEATLQKAQVIRRAALAPAEPSSQDRKVAAQASQLEAQARVELSRDRSAEDGKAAVEDGSGAEATSPASSASAQQSHSPSASSPPQQDVEQAAGVISSRQMRSDTQSAFAIVNESAKPHSGHRFHQIA